MLSRCFQGLARPISRRGCLGAFKISFGSSSAVRARCPGLSGVGALHGQGRLIAYPRKLGLDPLWINLQPPLAAFGHPPPNLQYPIGPGRGAVFVFPSKIPPPHRGYPRGQGPEVGLDDRSLMVKGLSSQKNSRHRL